MRVEMAICVRVTGNQSELTSVLYPTLVFLFLSSTLSVRLTEMLRSGKGAVMMDSPSKKVQASFRGVLISVVCWIPIRACKFNISTLNSALTDRSLHLCVAIHRNWRTPML